jgi:mono/diheme cytochrome c family protein
LKRESDLRTRFKGAFQSSNFYLLLLVLLVGACDGNMADQPKCQPLDQMDTFGKTNCALALPEGAISRDADVGNPEFNSGMSNGQPVADFPTPITLEMLKRGQNRYTIYCRPCHGAAGYGDGITVQYYFPAPPSFHTDALRNSPPGFFFDVITNGRGRMYSYASQISVPDRWAIVAYLKALQTSQYAPLDTLPDSDREQLPK